MYLHWLLKYSCVRITSWITHVYGDNIVSTFRMTRVLPTLALLALVGTTLTTAMKAQECLYHCTLLNDEPGETEECISCVADLRVNIDTCWKACGWAKTNNQLSQYCGRCFNKSPAVMNTMCLMACKSKNTIQPYDSRVCQVCFAYLSPDKLVFQDSPLP